MLQRTLTENPGVPKLFGLVFNIMSFMLKTYRDFVFISAVMERFKLSGLLKRVYNNRYSVFKKCIWALLLLASYKICIDLWYGKI